MATMNPYAPPRADLADIDDEGAETQPVRVWSASGRIGRLRYLAHLTAGYLLMLLVGGVLSAMLQGLGMPTAGGAAFFAAVAAYVVFALLKTFQRSHDMNWPGWTGLLAFIPIVGFAWIVLRGTQGANRYGAPPPANTLGVKILGLLFPVVMAIGIVAAIALPAYQDYVKRAQSAQTR